MRSAWKGLFLRNNSNLHKSSTLLNTMLKKAFMVHDGKSSKKVIVDRFMVGLKVGEFIFTRKMGALHKKKVLKNKKKNK